MTSLVHITTVPESLGFLRGQVGYMKERGFEVIAISSPGAGLAEFGDSEQVMTVAEEMPRRITPLLDLRALCRLVRVIRRLRPQIVHAHTPKGGLLGMISAWLAATPVRIYHMRGLPYVTASGKMRLLLMATERVSCRFAHRVFCVSHSLRDVAISDGLCPAHKIVVFHGGSGNGVDAVNRFNPRRFGPEHRNRRRAEIGIDTGAVVIGFVGRIVRDKGVYELASAWSMLRHKHPDAYLVLVGPIESQDPIDPQVLQRLCEDDRVRVLGRVPFIDDLYDTFDLVVLPTYREGFPNVPLEAAAMEIAVVATRIPGCVDSVKDGVTGMLVPPGDVVALQQAINTYLDDPELRRRHGIAGRKRVLREFRQEAIWEAIYAEYMRLLSAEARSL
jgi:glycosyltransferase involved in cell wall biosynthesis